MVPDLASAGGGSARPVMSSRTGRLNDKIPAERRGTTMPTQTLTLHLPDPLYTRLQLRTGSPIERSKPSFWKC